MNTLADVLSDAQLRDLVTSIRRARFNEGTKTKVTDDSTQMLDMKGRPLLCAIKEGDHWAVQVSLDIAGLMGLNLERDK